MSCRCRRRCCSHPDRPGLLPSMTKRSSRAGWRSAAAPQDADRGSGRAIERARAGGWEREIVGWPSSRAVTAIAKRIVCSSSCWSGSARSKRRAPAALRGRPVRRGATSPPMNGRDACRCAGPSGHHRGRRTREPRPKLAERPWPERSPSAARATSATTSNRAADVSVVENRPPAARMRVVFAAPPPSLSLLMMLSTTTRFAVARRRSPALAGRWSPAIAMKMMKNAGAFAEGSSRRRAARFPCCVPLQELEGLPRGRTGQIECKPAHLLRLPLGPALEAVTTATAGEGDPTIALIRTSATWLRWPWRV